MEVFVLDSIPIIRPTRGNYVALYAGGGHHRLKAHTILGLPVPCSLETNCQRMMSWQIPVAEIKIDYGFTAWNEYLTKKRLFPNYRTVQKR